MMKLACVTTVSFLADFIRERRYLLSHVFAFHPVMEAYVHDHYGGSLKGERESVSVHFRLGGDDEPWKEMVRDRPYPTARWYEHVMRTQFNVSKVIFLIFTDNVGKAAQILRAMPMHDTIQYQMIEEDFAMSMLLMSKCKHHIATVSTFSFWGAFLDKYQPNNGGKAIFPPKFTAVHNAPLPFSNWQVIPEPA